MQIQYSLVYPAVDYPCFRVSWGTELARLELYRKSLIGHVLGVLLLLSMSINFNSIIMNEYILQAKSVYPKFQDLRPAFRREKFS